MARCVQSGRIACGSRKNQTDQFRYLRAKSDCSGAGRHYRNCLFAYQAFSGASIQRQPETHYVCSASSNSIYFIDEHSEYALAYSAACRHGRTGTQGSGCSGSRSRSIGACYAEIFKNWLSRELSCCRHCLPHTIPIAYRFRISEGLESLVVHDSVPLPFVVNT